MNDATDLHAEVALRLFGWSCDGVDWNDAEGLWHRTPPAYSTDPAATALVWQWMERRGAPLDLVQFEYQAMEEEGICCTLQCGRGDCEGYGASWPEALCRAALALAEAVETSPGRSPGQA